MSFITDVAQWFETNDMPTAAQFVSMFNKLRWKDERIRLDEMEQSFINAFNALGQPIQKFSETGTFIYTIPAGYIVEWLLIKPSIDCTVTLNDGNGNVNDVNVIALHGEPIICMYNAGIDRLIEVSGLPPKTLVYVKRYALPL